MKKAQSSIELIVLVTAALIFLLALTSIFYQKVSQKTLEKRDFLIQELALTAQNELNIAAQAADGYYREFEIPQKIQNIDYNISLTGGTIYIVTADGKHAMALPAQNASGDFVKGANKIRKQNATVYLNN